MSNQLLSAQPSEQTEITPLPFDLDIDSISDWLKRLPTTDTTKTCTLSYSALQALAEQNLSPALRFNILERLRPFIFSQSVKLESYFIGTPFPLPRANRKMAKLSGKFHSELAFGYIKIVKSKIFTKRFPEEMQATVMHRALQSISLSLLGTTQMYEPSSPQLWRDFYKLYRRTEKLKLLDICVDETLPGFRSKSTPLLVIKKTLLFALSNSQRNSQVEIKQHYFLLDQYAQHLLISKSEKLEEKKADYAMDLKSTTPPQSSLQSKGKSNRYLYLQAFTAKLTQLVKTQNATSTPFDSATPNSITRMATVFGSLEGFEPGADKRDMFLIPRLKNIISVLAAAKTPDPGLRDNGTESWLRVPNFELVPLADGKNNRSEFTHELSANGSEQTTLRTAWDGIAELGIKTEYTGDNRQTCQLFETQMEPMCLVETYETRVVPGDLIGLQKTPDQLMVGLVRWGSPVNNGASRHVIVEILAPDANLADARIGDYRLENIVFLNDTYSGDQPCSVLLPPARYRSGTPLEINLNGEVFGFTIQKLLENSLVFQQYALVGEGPRIH